MYERKKKCYSSAKSVPYSIKLEWILHDMQRERGYCLCTELKVRCADYVYSQQRAKLKISF